jgi:hypothetical protein
MLIFIVLFVVIVIILNVIIVAATPRTPTKRVLQLREITSPASSMVVGQDDIHKNVFVAEFVVLFEYISNILDYSVMKYVGEDVSILSRQEGKHAVLHIAAMKHRKLQGEHATRWKWFLWLADLLLLRCGRALGVSLVTHIEAAAWSWFFFPIYLPFVKNGLPNLFVFHGMEEVEHGALTVQSLRKQTNVVFSLLTFPIVIIVHIVLLLCPPISAIMMNPKLLLLPQTYLNLINYYLAFGPGFIGSTIGQIVYCLLPFHESQFLFQLMHKIYEGEIKARGITFKVVDQDTYTLL